MKNKEETAKSLLNTAKPNEEEIISSNLVVEAKPEVLVPRSNLKPGQTDTINNTKEVSESASSGADKSSKSE